MERIRRPGNGDGNREGYGMTTHDPSDHLRHAHLDGGACLDGSGRTWQPARQPGEFPIIPVGLGPGHDVDLCSVCARRSPGPSLARTTIDVALVLALGCLLVLLLAAWWLPAS